VLPGAGSITVTPGAAPAFHLIAPQAGSLAFTGRVPFTVESGLGVVGPIDKPGISKGGGRDIEKGGTGLHSGPTAPGITRGGSRDIESSQDC
jgi:hypothetical protein